MISYTSRITVISVLYRKEYVIQVYINFNNFTINSKGDIVVKLKLRLFTLYLRQFVSRVVYSMFLES